MELKPGQLVAEMREGRAWRVRLVRSNDGITVILDNGSRWTATGSRRAEGHRDEGWTLREITKSQCALLMPDHDDDERCRDTYALGCEPEPEVELQPLVVSLVTGYFAGMALASIVLVAGLLVWIFQ